jgi:hypothetical protein
VDVKPKRILIGFPDDIMEILRQRAEENVRSLNGEVVHLVRFALARLAEKDME